MRPSLTNTQSTTMPGYGYCLIDQGSTATAGPPTPWRQHQNPSRYCSPLSPLLISFLVRCSASSFLKPPPVKFDREKETPTCILSDVQARGCGDGIWINEMKKGVDVKYQNDGRILWLSSFPPAGFNVDDVPLGQILEMKATHFCSQTMNIFCSLFNKLN
ncbi:hypothetical protein VPH35_046253 [Triticum aestivum]